MPALTAFLIRYAHINDYRDFGGNGQNKRATRAAYKAKTKYTKRSRDHVKCHFDSSVNLLAYYYFYHPITGRSHSCILPLVSEGWTCDSFRAFVLFSK